MGLWTTFTQLGTNDEMDASFRKRVVLTNVTSLLFSFTMTIFAALFTVMRIWPPVWFSLLCTITLLLPLVLNRLREQAAAQVALMMSNAVGMGISAREEKWVKIEVSSSQRHLTLTVTDSGPGIPTKIEDKIFQPFFTTKDIGSGMGPGLSISHTRFKIVLPVAG